jgi:hypothetical protein
MRVVRAANSRAIQNFGFTSGSVCRDFLAMGPLDTDQMRVVGAASGRQRQRLLRGLWGLLARGRAREGCSSANSVFAIEEDYSAR